VVVVVVAAVVVVVVAVVVGGLLLLLLVVVVLVGVGVKGLAVVRRAFFLACPFKGGIGPKGGLDNKGGGGGSVDKGGSGALACNTAAVDVSKRCFRDTVALRALTGLGGGGVGRVMVPSLTKSNQ
jgi:hypothetical protein